MQPASAKFSDSLALCLNAYLTSTVKAFYVFSHVIAIRHKLHRYKIYQLKMTFHYLIATHSRVLFLQCEKISKLNTEKVMPREYKSTKFVKLQCKLLAKIRQNKVLSG